MPVDYRQRRAASDRVSPDTKGYKTREAIENLQFSRPLLAPGGDRIEEPAAIRVERGTAAASICARARVRARADAQSARRNGDSGRPIRAGRRIQRRAPAADGPPPLCAIVMTGNRRTTAAEGCGGNGGGVCMCACVCVWGVGGA